MAYVSNLSTVKEKEEPRARIPYAFPHDERQERTAPAQGQGPEAAYGITPMKRINRLGRGRELGALLRYGRRISSPLFQLLVRPSGFTHPRFVFIAARAVDKRAVVRNRLRRRVREYLRKNIKELHPGRDIAVIIKKEAASASRNEFYEDLRRTVSRI